MLSFPSTCTSKKPLVMQRTSSEPYRPDFRSLLTLEQLPNVARTIAPSQRMTAIYKRWTAYLLLYLRAVAP